MARLVLGIVLVLLFIAGLFGDPPSIPAYLAGGSAIFLVPATLCFFFGVRGIRRGRATPAPSPQQSAGPAGRPAGAPVTAAAQAAQSPAWYLDPTGRHEQRFWDGEGWTRHVADQGSTSIEPSDVHELTRVLGDSSDLTDRVVAARMLGALGDTRAVQPLVEVAVAVGQPPELRAAALAALATIGEPSAAEPLVAAAVSGALGSLSSSDVGRALARIGDAASLAPLLVKVMSSNDDYDDYHDPFAYETAEYFTSTDREWQEGISDDCAVILASAGEPGVDALLAATSLGSSRTAVARALGGVPNPPLERLSALAHSPDSHVRAAAIAAIGEVAQQQESLRESLVGVLREATEDADDVVRETAKHQAALLEPTGSDDAAHPQALVSDEHRQRKAAIDALRTSGDQDPEEPRTLQDLGDPSVRDAADPGRDLREHADFDVAYMLAAYPTGLSEDHAHADPAILRAGVASCRRKAFLLARLSSYRTWQGDCLAALDHAVAAVLLGDPSQGPGDMVQVIELLTAAFRRAERFQEAVTAAAVQAPYALGPHEADAVERAVAELAERYPDEVAWAADTVRGKLTTTLSAKRHAL